MHPQLPTYKEWRPAALLLPHLAQQQPVLTVSTACSQQSHQQLLPAFQPRQQSACKSLFQVSISIVSLWEICP